MLFGQPVNEQIAIMHSSVPWWRGEGSEPAAIVGGANVVSYVVYGNKSPLQKKYTDTGTHTQTHSTHVRMHVHSQTKHVNVKTNLL